MRLASFSSSGRGSDFNPVMFLMLFGTTAMIIFAIYSLVFTNFVSSETVSLDESLVIDVVQPEISGGAVAVGVAPEIEVVNALRPIDEAEPLADYFDTFTDTDLPENYRCEMTSTDEPITKRELIVVDDKTFVMYATGHKFDCNYW